jgi:hypothetical protein
MTTDGTVPERIIVEAVAGDAYYVADGTVVAVVTAHGGHQVELRMGEVAARGLADQLREQLRLLDAYRAEAGPGIDPAAPSVTSGLLGEAPDGP